MLTAVGDDRPGLVDEVTRYITERGGNLEDSRMVNLRGQFAMMMLVAGSEEAMSRLQDGLGALRRGSHVHAELRPADAGAAERPPALPFRLNTWAMDHPGLMQSVSHLLGEMGVNIESVDSSLRPAPYTNAPLFEMELVVSVPAATHVADAARGARRALRRDEHRLAAHRPLRAAAPAPRRPRAVSLLPVLPSAEAAAARPRRRRTMARAPAGRAPARRRRRLLP